MGHFSRLGLPFSHWDFIDRFFFLPVYIPTFLRVAILISLALGLVEMLLTNQAKCLLIRVDLLCQIIKFITYKNESSCHMINILLQGFSRSELMDLVLFDYEFSNSVMHLKLSSSDNFSLLLKLDQIVEFRACYFFNFLSQFVFL